MTADELREKRISELAEMLRHIPFEVEFKARKRPRGVRIVFEMTQDYLNKLLSKNTDRL